MKDRHGVEYSYDRKTLIKCPKDRRRLHQDFPQKQGRLEWLGEDCRTGNAGFNCGLNFA